jgi:hypothetical protein
VIWYFWGIQLDQSLLEEQSKAYRVEGVDENAPPVTQRKRKKQHVNGEEVRPTPPFPATAFALIIGSNRMSRINLRKKPKSLASTQQST